MAGKSENMPGMWAKLQEVLDLDPPVAMTENTYLGCNQLPLYPGEEMVRSKSLFYEHLIHTEDSATATNAAGNTVHQFFFF